ncbi:hypothetical protein Tco_0091915 [Tanacetum coccineum]
MIENGSVSPRLFTLGLKVNHLPPASSLNETTVGCTRDIVRQRDCLDRFSEVSWVIPALAVIESEILYEFSRFFDAFVTKLTTSRMIDGLPCGGIDMVVKDLALEPKIDTMMRDFLKEILKTSPYFEKRFTMMLLEHQDVISKFGSSSRWEKVSKEMGSEILPSGDGSRGKTFKPIASLIAKGKLK